MGSRSAWTVALDRSIRLVTERAVALVFERCVLFRFRPLETSAVDGLSNKILINERPASIGKNMSMERKDMLKDVTLADVVDFPEMNSNLPSAASTCDNQSDAMCQLLRLPGELAPEVLVKCASEQKTFQYLKGNGPILMDLLA